MEKSQNEIVFIDLKQNQVIIDSLNIKFIATKLNTSISIEFTQLNEFTQAFGLIGSTVNYNTIYAKFIIINKK